jgi:hypothetical protein
MSKDVAVMTSVGTDNFRGADFSVKDGILWVKELDSNYCYPLNSVIFYVFKDTKEHV